MFWSPSTEDIKLFFMRISTEHDLYPYILLKKVENANNCWYFNMYEQYKWLAFVY